MKNGNQENGLTKEFHYSVDEICHSVVLIPKGSWFFKCFFLGLCLLATQLRILVGGPNPVLITT